MDHNLNNIAQELYDKLRTRFTTVKIGDENAAVLSKKEDIPKARFFEFEYIENGQSFGTVSITIDSDDGLVVQTAGEMNNISAGQRHLAYKFFRSLGQFAKDRLMNFKINNIGKSNLDKRDYDYHAKRKEPQPMNPIMENKMYGTAKISYQDLGEAKLIVKHNQPINPELPAGRTMHIESIYIENAVGERFKYPYKHLNGARALAEHIKHGGNPYDSIGKHITGLSEELGSLRKFKNYVSRQDQISEAMGDVTTKVIERIESVKKEISNLQRASFYEAFAESFKSPEEKIIPEHVMNDWIDRLTIRTFNEELKGVFPYLYNIVDESQLPVLEITADDILGEDEEDDHFERGYNEGYNPNSASAQHRRELDDHLRKTLKARAEADNASDADKARYQRYLDTKEAMRNWYNDRMERESIEAQYESIISSIVTEDEEDEILSPNKDVQNQAIEKLNKIISSELKGGPGGTNAIQSLKGIIDDPEFINTLKNTAPDLDVRALIQQYLLQAAPDVLGQLDFPDAEGSSSAETQPEAEPVTPAPDATAAAPDATATPTPPAPDATAAAPAPAPAPVAESNDDDDLPFDPDPVPSKKVTAGKHGQDYSQARHLARRGLLKAIQSAKKAGAKLDTEIDLGHRKMTIADCIDECGMTPMECGFEDEQSGAEKMLKFVSGFYNKDEGNFPLGGQRIKIKVQKAFENGEFDGATPNDLRNILSLIDKKDPSGNEHNQIMRLAGLKHNTEVDEAGQNQPGLDNMISNMKLQFGDDTIDFSNPDQAASKMQGMVGKMMQGVQGQVPNQNIQVPGGQLNPQEMMKNILMKIQGGK